MKQNDENSFPVASITAGVQPSIGCFLIRFDFLTNSMQSVDQPNPGRNYMLTAEQARYLAERILSQLPILENTGTQGTAHPKH